jgi:hypothetical protein
LEFQNFLTQTPKGGRSSLLHSDLENCRSGSSIAIRAFFAFKAGCREFRILNVLPRFLEFVEVHKTHMATFPSKNQNMIAAQNKMELPVAD